MSESVATAPEGEIAQDAPVVDAPDARANVAPEEGPLSPEEEAAAAGYEAEEPEEAPVEEDAAPEPVEEIEFDLGGTALKVPKGAIPENVAEEIAKWTKAAQAAHTQRSQALAENRKQVEATFAEAQKFRKMSEGVAEGFATGRALLAQVQQDEARLSEQLYQTNPDEYRMVSDRAALNRRRLDETIRNLSAEEQHLEHAERQRAEQSAEQMREQTARMAEEGRKIVQTAIPTFNASEEAKLIAYAVKQGIPENEAKIWSLNPTSAIAFHKAMLWDEAKAAARPVKEPPKPPAAPIKGLASRASAIETDPNRMNIEQYAAWRKAHPNG